MSIENKNSVVLNNEKYLYNTFFFLIWNSKLLKIHN